MIFGAQLARKSAHLRFRKILMEKNNANRSIRAPNSPANTIGGNEPFDSGSLPVGPPSSSTTRTRLKSLPAEVNR